MVQAMISSLACCEMLILSQRVTGGAQRQEACMALVHGLVA